jgi:hypothetical protein
MNEITVIWIFVLLALICVPLTLYFRSTNAIINESGICANGNVTKGVNQILNRNRSSNDFFMNLTSDNRQLAELMCQNISNNTMVR